MSEQFDAIVIGSGPNGLAAAITLAKAGRSVRVYEATAAVGGGMRTAELTEPGFLHDVCSAVHPLGAGSPFFRSLALERYGLEWVQPEIAMAHPLEGGTAGILHNSLEETALALGRDGDAYRGLMAPFVEEWDNLLESIMGSVLRVPAHPLLMARFGLQALQSGRGLIRSKFRTEQGRVLFGGMAAHATLPLAKPLTASFGLVLGAAAHSVGWPVARGGSQAIADALTACLKELGGEIATSSPIRSMADLPPARAYLFDLTPRQLLAIAGDRLGGSYAKQLRRYRYGAGVFKLDYSLDGPVPWTNEAARRAGTVHVGGDLSEVIRAERMVGEGLHPEKPYVITAQQSVADPTRAPAGKHTFWAYCHVPNGSPEDMRDRIEAQVERFAPGFRDLIRERHVTPPPAWQAYNENYVGGDIAGGSHEGLQLFLRPAARLNPYTTPARDIYICSSSTPPGAGVHGMGGYHAARAALSRALR